MADSASEAVGDAVKAAVEALAITSGDPAVAVPVVKRKAPTLPEGKNPPGIVVSVGAEIVEKIDAFTDLLKYPVAVTIVTGEGTKAADDPVVRKWREQIRKKLQARASFAGLSGFNVVSTAGKEPFDVSALSKDFNYSALVFTVEIEESRT